MADTTVTATTAPVVTRGLVGGNVLPLLMFLIFLVTPLFAMLTAESYVLSLVTRVMIFAIAAVTMTLQMVPFGYSQTASTGALTGTTAH